MCLCVAAYLSLMGPRGLREVNELSYAGAHYLHDELLKLDCFEETFPGKPFLNEFTLTYKGVLPLDELRQALGYEGFLAGVMAEGSTDQVIFAVTEQRSKEETDKFIACLAALAERGEECNR